MVRHIAQALWLCVAIWCAAAAGAPAVPAPLMLDRASVVVELEERPPLVPAAEVRLPYNWHAALGTIGGRARFTMHFSFPDAASAQALYVLRIGDSFSMVLNGVEIAQMQTASRYKDYSKRPRLYPIPPGILKAQNTLEITLAAHDGRYSGLTPVLIGDTDTLRAVYDRDYFWRITGALVIAIISGVLGTLALVLWLRQRDPLYLLYGAAELLWALQVSDTWITHAPLPWPWWGVVTFSGYALAPVLICKFALTVMEAHQGFIKHFSDWQLRLSVPVVFLFVLGRMPWVWTVLQGLIVLLCVAVGIVVVAKGLRSEAVEKRVMAIATMVTVAAAVRDFIVIKLGSTYGHISWARYTWVVFGLTLAWVIAERMRKDARSLSQMNETLAQQLAVRESELQAVFERERINEKTRGMLEERTRLMRDMHDGLGSQLAGVLQLAKNPSAPRAVVAAQLQDALDHLKLTVDAMQETDGDIGSLLGALRYRLAPRLEAAAIALAWDVGRLPLIPGWTIQRSRNLQMILFEAFSNLIAHSGATHAHLVAAYDDREDSKDRVVRVMLTDNGRGFDVGDMSRLHGHGLANMRARAASMGAILEVRSSAAGSQIQLILPLKEQALVKRGLI